MHHRKRHLFLGTTVTASLLLAACGSGGDLPVAVGGSPHTDTTGSSTPDTTAPDTTAPEQAQDVFTPVVVTPMGPVPQAVEGTDGRFHVVYELELINTKSAPATIEVVEVLDAAAPDEPIVSYAGEALVGRLVTTQPRPVDSPVIELDQVRILYVELAFDSLEQVPSQVVHHVQLLAAASPGPVDPTPMAYTVAPVEVSTAPTLVLGPPLAGPDWVAINGCCLGTTVHRGSFQSVNGGLFDAQRFAIDWMRVNDAGELVAGDPTVNGNYPAYGAEVLAVADATVIATLDTLEDQVAGTLPDPRDITLQTVDGNHVVLDLGDGRYAFYAHLQQGSVTVEPGDTVEAGQVLGLLGNSGNSSGPHLHFHVMDRPSVLGSEGLPYVIEGFELTGQIDPDAFAAAPGVEGVWLSGPRPAPVVQHDRFPLNLNVVTFP